MFLNYLKDIFAKKIVKKSLSNVQPAVSAGKIATVGILMDAVHLNGHPVLLRALAAQGIAPHQIATLVFKDRIKKEEKIPYEVFGYKDLNWSGNITSAAAQHFMAQPFDLLISYYDHEKAPLTAVTQGSAARFKAGFAAVDKRLNHFMISSPAEAYAPFSEELFKYLQILEKI